MSRRPSTRVARRLVEEELQGGEEDEDEEDCNLSDDVASDDVASDDDAPIAARPRKLRRKRRKQPAASAVEEAELSDSEQPAKRNRKPRAGRQGRKNSGFGVSWVLNRVVLEARWLQLCILCFTALPQVTRNRCISHQREKGLLEKSPFLPWKTRAPLWTILGAPHNFQKNPLVGTRLSPFSFGIGKQPRASARRLVAADHGRC